MPLQLAKLMATPLPDQGMVGTLAACARMVLPILSPRAAMGAAGGPRKRMSEGSASRAVGSSGFSEAWPLQTALSHNLQDCPCKVGLAGLVL